MAKKKVSKKKATAKKTPAKATPSIEKAVEQEQTRIQKVRAYKDEQAQAFNKKFRS